MSRTFFLWRRCLAVARKEVRQLSRDRIIVGWIIGVPLIQLSLFGYAITQDIRRIPTALVDHSSSAVSRRLAGRLEATQTFRVTERPVDEATARQHLVDGGVQAMIVIPSDFDRSFYRGRGAQVSVRVDATDPILARAAQTAVNGLAERLQSEAAFVDAPSATRREVATPDLIHPGHVELTVLTEFNPELRTALFVVPALLGVILTTTMILMTALSIVREREKGTYEMLIATPVRRIELVVGKIVPYVGIGIVQIAIVLLAGLGLFRVPVSGSLVHLGIGAILFVAANLTLGLLISAVTVTQFQATQLSFFFFLPSVLLSGFMFPFDAMPRPAQWLGELLPLTHFVRISRAVLLRGASIWTQLPALGAMLLFLLVTLTLATTRLRRGLD